MAARVTRHVRALLCISVAAFTLVHAGTRLPLPAERAIAEVTGDELRAHVHVLASDELAGRGVGQPGNRRAEVYVEEAMRRAGALPAVGDDYLQPVSIYQPALGSGGRLTVESAGQQIVELKKGEDFYPLPESGAGTATARLVFAGHGISAPQARHDDYVRSNVRGAIALLLDGAPGDLADEEAFASVARKARDAFAHGAIGIVVIRNHLGDVQAMWPEGSSGAWVPHRLFSDLQKSGMPIAAISQRAAASIRRGLESGAELTATLTAGVDARPITVNNVLGLVEGRDPVRSEMVIVGAHLDHDGVDTSGKIFNGADDNASGTAAVIAVAGAFARAAAQGERPHRGVLFALWNAEEKGSLGAEAYLDAPQPPRRIVAKINLDMVGRAEHVPDPNDPRFRGFARTSPAQSANVIHVLGYSYSPDLAGIIASANDEVGLKIQQEYDQGAQDLLRRSDNWPFLRRSIPAVFLTTGLHPDYHTPDDDVERIDFGKLLRVTRLAARAAWLAAEGPAPRMAK
jgi:hypothetical protein